MFVIKDENTPEELDAIRTMYAASDAAAFRQGDEQKSIETWANAFKELAKTDDGRALGLGTTNIHWVADGNPQAAIKMFETWLSIFDASALANPNEAEMYAMTAIELFAHHLCEAADIMRDRKKQLPKRVDQGQQINSQYQPA